jgi:hypothetical protein
MFGRLMPTEGKFFDLFIQHGELCVKGGRELVALMTNFDDLEHRVHAIETIEKQADSAWKWAIMFAIAHPGCGGRSIADVANQIGVSRALISSRATEFCRLFHLKPSSYMRSEATASKAARARERFVANQNGH